MSKTVLFQTIQFSISTRFSSIWPIDRNLSGATTQGQSGPGSDGNEGVPCILQSSSITGTSPSDCLVSYPGYSFYPSAEKQFVYSTAPVHWPIRVFSGKELFCWDSSHQGAILTLAYPWYTNSEQNGRKDKITAFQHMRLFNLLYT